MIKVGRSTQHTTLLTTHIDESQLKDLILDAVVSVAGGLPNGSVERVEVKFLTTTDDLGNIKLAAAVSINIDHLKGAEAAAG